MSEVPQKPLFKNVKVMQLSDLLAGGMKVAYNQDKTGRAILTTMGEMAVYKYLGRIIGEHVSVAQLSGSGNDVRRLVEKQNGKNIEEDLAVGIISQTDNGLRKKQAYKQAMMDGIVNSAISYGSRYLADFMGGDQDVLDFIRGLNPFDPLNKE